MGRISPSTLPIAPDLLRTEVVWNGSNLLAFCYGPVDWSEHHSSHPRRLIACKHLLVLAPSHFVPPMEIAVTGSSDDDELTALVARVRDGNAGAFDELAHRVRDRVTRWARGIVDDRDEAEDVAQLVLVRLHERLEEFEGRSRFGSWLYRITRNVALERRRVEARRSAIIARELATTDDSAAESLERDDADSARIRELVAAYFDALSPRQREVFELVELRGVPANDVATRLGVEPSTVRVLLLRARRTIRARMLAQHPHLLEDYRS